MADDDANVVSFRPRSESPSVPLPPLPPTPQARTPVFAGVGASEGEVGERSAPAGVWPSLPTVADMSPPPTALAMPGLPKPSKGDDGGAGEDDGDFVPPAPKDPENPTVKDMLAVCMAIVTAIGVAAGGGLWARFRHRQALADEARARADRADQKAAGRGAKGADGGKGSSLLSSGGSRTKGGGKNRPPQGPRGDSHNGPGRGKSGGKAPKADKDGKTKWGRDKPKQRRKDRGKDPFKLRKRRPGADRDRKSPKKPDVKKPKDGDKSTPKPPKKPGGKLRWKPSKRRGKGPRGWTSGRPGSSRKRKADEKRRRLRPDRLSWKAPKRKPGRGGKAIAGRKRWKRTPRIAPKRRKLKQWRRKRFVRPRVHRRWRRTRAWATNWRLRRRARAATRSTHGPGQAGAHRAGTGGTWAPPPGFERMRPPPWADRRPWHHVERVDDPPRERWDKPSGRPELPPAPSPGPNATPEPAPPPAAPDPTGQPPTMTDNDVKTGVPYMPVPAPRMAGAAIPWHGAQFRDAELTIRDVVEAGEEMAEEILAGVDTAERSAAMCETLAARLETLHAELCELEVPGILIPNVAVLLDKAEDVRGKALAIAEGLPLASEAMRVASANAAVRHQPTADVTRDMGHIKPAERPYHEE